MKKGERQLLYQPDAQYKKFNERLVSTKYELAGVRVPVLRQIAKDIVKGQQWQQFLFKESKFHEDVQLKSFVLAQAPMSVEERHQQLEQFFPLMDNWQVVDGLCSSLKEAKKYPESYWKWLQTLQHSEEPFTVRFVVVMYLTYFLTEDYLEDVLSYYESLHLEHYYVKMAVAWALSIAFIKQEARLMMFFKETELDDWTYNKALQKIVESRQVDSEMKELAKKWKRSM